MTAGGSINCKQILKTLSEFSQPGVEMTILMIILGGGLGAVCRYAVTLWLQPVATDTGNALMFPAATLVVNLAGCFLLALLATWAARGSVSPAIQAGLAVGFLGSFTTFSTFAMEGQLLARDGAHLMAVSYLAGSVVLGYLMILAGRATANWLMDVVLDSPVS